MNIEEYKGVYVFAQQVDGCSQAASHLSWSAKAKKLSKRPGMRK